MVRKFLYNVNIIIIITIITNPGPVKVIVDVIDENAIILPQLRFRFALVRLFSPL